MKWVQTQSLFLIIFHLLHPLLLLARLTTVRNKQYDSLIHLMYLLADIAVFCVAIFHLCFMALEMFLWDKSAGHKIFGIKPEFASKTRTLAANQGLYNGFLAAGLLWSLWAGQFTFRLQIFFLGCVVVAGLFGGITTSRSIIWIQALPGTIALVLVFLAQSTY